MKNFLKRILFVFGLILFVTTICTIVPLIFLQPLYWIITGRSYCEDVFYLTHPEI